MRHLPYLRDTSISADGYVGARRKLSNSIFLRMMQACAIVC